MADDTSKALAATPLAAFLGRLRISDAAGARTLKDAVSAATTAQALAAIDPSKGWQQQIATAQA
jgi:hypothetical protein